MFYFLSKLLDLAVAPLSWAIVFVGAALFVRTARRRALLLVLALAVLVLFASPPVANRLARVTEMSAERTVRADVTYDAVILLGGFVDGNMSDPAGQRFYNQDVERLLAVFDLLRDGRAKVAILSGGRTEGGVVESQVMADQLASWGIDPARLIVEGESKNTRENAVDSAAIVRARGFGSLLVVTSAFHVPRAHGCFRAVGLDVDMFPVDYRSYDPALVSRPFFPRALALEESTTMLREWTGRFVYRLRGYSTS